MIRAASRPPLHDSASPSRCPFSSFATWSSIVCPSRLKVSRRWRRASPSRTAIATASVSSRQRTSISISPRRRQVVTSTASTSTPSSSSISRRLLAISDSGTPNIRIVSPCSGVVRARMAFTPSVASATGHIGCSSRGGPGRTITTRSGPSPNGTTSPGAVPTGSSASAPSGTIACLRLAAITASSSNLKLRFLAKRRRIVAIFASISWSSFSGRPAKRPTISPVRSSAVGPRPPLVTIRSIPSASRNFSASSRSSGRSATTMMWATSIPSSASRSLTQGPLTSVMRAVITSVPVTTIPALTTPSFTEAKLPDRVGQAASPSTSAPTGEGVCPPLPDPGPPTTRARSACVISTWRGFEPS